jgi:DNA-binding CsgD family transcriptional regulator
MSWNDIVTEVMKRKANGQKAGLFSGKNYGNPYIRIRRKNLDNKRKLKIYDLGSKYGGLYFTKREAECMMWLLKGKTINGVAAALNLSPRTVEYYIKNMKIKIGCRTKFELIDLVHSSEFTKNINFDIENTVAI